MKFNETLLTQVNQGRQTRRIDRARKSNSLVLLIWLHVKKQGRIQDFFYEGCTRLLLYFNTNKPHSFFWQNTSCIRKPQVISGGEGRGAHPLHPPPRSVPEKVFRLQQRTYIMSWNYDLISHHLSNWQDQHTSFILKVYFLFHVLNYFLFWCRFVSPLFHLALKQSFILCS